jgi:hypothetical protein
MISLSKEDMDFIRPYDYQNLVRIGSKGDGGYLVPEDVIKDITCCISCGIGYNHEFEKHLQKLVMMLYFSKHLNFLIFTITDSYQELTSLKLLLNVES